MNLPHTYTQSPLVSLERSSDSEDTEHFLTPTTVHPRLPAISLSNKCYVTEIRQIDGFIQSHAVCKRPGCRGKLIPVQEDNKRMGGAVRVTYRCRKCSKRFLFGSCSNNPKTTQNSTSKAKQVAFITAGCTHATYAKVLVILGMNPASKKAFMKTLEEMHPVVKNMVNEMCECEKERMKALNPKDLGSWSQAVTSADGTWLTRGHHSKNATFSIRNYLSGALLYYKHLCQKGRDHIIKEELYKGTSKSAEGYGAMELFQKAKEEGLQIAVHWQDADSTASSRAKQFFPRAKIMICGGHAGKSHLKQLQCRPQQRKFSSALQKKDGKYIQTLEVLIAIARK